MADDPTASPAATAPASGAHAAPAATEKPTRRELVKAFTASLTGTSLEWYDFAVYSAASAVVFPVVFFPSSDPYTATILAFLATPYVVPAAVEATWVPWPLPSCAT